MFCQILQIMPLEPRRAPIFRLDGSFIVLESGLHYRGSECPFRQNGSEWQYSERFSPHEEGDYAVGPDNSGMFERGKSRLARFGESIAAEKLAVEMGRLKSELSSSQNWLNQEKSPQVSPGACKFFSFEGRFNRRSFAQISTISRRSRRAAVVRNFRTAQI